MARAKKILIFFLLILVALGLIAGCYFFVGRAPKQKKITWGVNFSQMQAVDLGLDWKQLYLALLEDLGALNIKLITNWDVVEPKKGVFDFTDTDWQVNQAEDYHVNILYVVGMKTGRWPECHVPGWAGGMPKQAQQEEILAYVKETVLRYKNSPAIIAWQAENEPLFRFGKCPWYDKAFLKKEIALIKSLDPSRPVVVSDSGEQSLWLAVANIGDIVGVTTYRSAWFHVTDKIGFYFKFPVPPVFYWRRAQIINYFFGKKVIGVELQAEPWAPKPFSEVSLDEQEKTMNLAQFKKNIAYAKATGLDTFYFWGTEWWFWLKEKQARPEIWNTAKELFR
ncbi:MAG: hypothetical protein A3D44_00200 [Candidatus Staskawiczbacteria bacterium RIFCSPHIGHO2_02_FULL_42_22]|uniref:Glycoside hydrolase family 2 catalytic domain-containing protein n=1 Tax=Candidatus Staskawiczbacteria bacterium RIFCSPHIGHO2_02_FULL_42_22 TaxID=1802207 RepID=A0A1G2I2I3_9BACT|nr:MAG: hypothetical protein A3D44_00200 [Candidatus Staskawiczbacteria bacterium RIFCSPHIGHO2_02_FULL_42_22]